uniref:Uncharacterized protein n=1 Tax=Timema douglasi TaxID=61478 RepID=A0A7R8VF85_TIMDO|nr:unnamed protein product [Timema douglasi]
MYLDGDTKRTTSVREVAIGLLRGALLGIEPRSKMLETLHGAFVSIRKHRIFRVTCGVTTLLLITCSIIITMHQYVGNPIDCVHTRVKIRTILPMFFEATRRGKIYAPLRRAVLPLLSPTLWSPSLNRQQIYIMSPSIPHSAANECQDSPPHP